jgi:hypothetical protein
MDDIMRDKLLKIALVVVGAIFFTIYPLGLFSGTAVTANITFR